MPEEQNAEELVSAGGRTVSTVLQLPYRFEQLIAAYTGVLLPGIIEFDLPDHSLLLTEISALVECIILQIEEPLREAISAARDLVITSYAEREAAKATCQIARSTKSADFPAAAAQYFLAIESHTEAQTALEKALEPTRAYRYMRLQIAEFWAVEAEADLRARAAVGVLMIARNAQEHCAKENILGVSVENQASLLAHAERLVVLQGLDPSKTPTYHAHVARMARTAARLPFEGSCILQPQ